MKRRKKVDPFGAASFDRLRTLSLSKGRVDPEPTGRGAEGLIHHLLSGSPIPFFLFSPQAKVREAGIRSVALLPISPSPWQVWQIPLRYRPMPSAAVQSIVSMRPSLSLESLWK